MNRVDCGANLEVECGVRYIPRDKGRREATIGR